MKKQNFILPLQKYPEGIRKYISTNAVESVNSMIEKIRIKSGGYFNSVETLEINIYLQRENLIKTKWKKPIPMIAAHFYDIQQIFQLKYLFRTQNSLQVSLCLNELPVII